MPKGAGNVWFLSFSPDGAKLIHSSFQVWDLRQKTEIWRGSDGGPLVVDGVAIARDVRHLAVSADGRHLACISNQGTVFIFRLPSN
jgi:hypothetical protein